MSFFEPLPPPPPLFLAEVDYRQPAWLGPPANVLPGVVPVELLVARTDEAVVAVTGIRAYPTGLGFTLSLHLRRLTEPTPPVLTAHGGGGGGKAWDADQWVWPLPPAGPLAFVCEWPARQVAESRVELDARLVRQAAERAVTLWPDD